MMFLRNVLGWNVRLRDWGCSWQGTQPLPAQSQGVLMVSPAGGYLNGAVIVTDGGRLCVRPSVF